MCPDDDSDEVTDGGHEADAVNMTLLVVKLCVYIMHVLELSVKGEVVLEKQTAQMFS